jgi:hypothetical protein
MFKPRLFNLLDHLKRIPQIISLYERGERIEYIGAVVGIHPSSVRKSRAAVIIGVVESDAAAVQRYGGL